MHRSWSAATALFLLAGGCALPLDILGEEQVAKQQDHLQGLGALSDDRITDKQPVFDDTLTIQEGFGPCEIILNKSGSVTKLDVMPFAAADGSLGTTLFPDYIAAANALGTRPMLPSMELVNAALKPFDDGLYAAVELGAEDGSEASPIAKRSLLADLLAELLVRSTTGAAAEQPLALAAAGTIGAALQLGGGQIPPSIATDSAAIVQQFDTDPFASRPIGFYTWTPALSAIFRQDRLLQVTSVPVSFGAFAAVAAALNGTPSLSARYGKVLGLYSGLTNPFFDRPVSDLQPFAPDGTSLANLNSIQSAFAAAHPETRAAEATCAARLAFFPASDSPETRLFRTLYCDTPIPPGTNLFEVLIGAIRSGMIDLTPTATSGWYDRQLYALETLLVPDRASEKDHLFLTQGYKKKLVETFKTLVTETRETHVKQLGTFSSTSGGIALPPTPIDVYPLLRVEPFPTFYLRTARAYAFLKSLLASVLGPPFLATAHRVLEAGGSSPMALGDELDDKIAFVYGLHVLAADSIGMRPALTADEAAAYPVEADRKRGRAWLDAWRADPDIAKDPRVIVPLGRDLNTGTARYWAVIGTSVVKTQARFYPAFEPRLVNTGACVFRSWVDTQPFLLTGQTVDITRPLKAPPPTRAEFRSLCDRAKTRDAIVHALENP
jgi:hypothetical protein